MLLLLPILAPVAGGIFVFRQKKESVRNRLVLALMLVTAGLVCAVCLTPEQTVELLTIQGRLHLALRSDLLAKFFLVLITCIWAPITLFAFPYIRHEGRDRQFFGFYTMTLGILAGLATWWAVHPPAGVAAVLLVPLIADGLLQLCTPYESGNLRRLATGLLFGYGLTVLLLTSLGWAYQWGFGFGKTLLDP